MKYLIIFLFLVGSFFALAFMPPDIDPRYEELRINRYIGTRGKGPIPKTLKKEIGKGI